jgi:hypothetical protein
MMTSEGRGRKFSFTTFRYYFTICLQQWRDDVMLQVKPLRDPRSLPSGADFKYASTST